MPARAARTPPGASMTSGLVAAAVTAFRPDGTVDLEFVPCLADHLAKQGVAGVFVNGTTGEGMSLSVDDRKSQAEAWKAALPKPMKLFVHVGAHALPEARALAAHAEQLGADAIAALAPGFFKPSGISGLVDWCEGLASAAPATPFYFYHMPSMTGVPCKVVDFLEAADGRMPSLAGVKFTFEALDDFLLCQRVSGGKFDILWGRDEMLLAGLATGAAGAVGSTYNIVPSLYLRLIKAFEAGDLTKARDLQAAACELIGAMAGTGNFFGALKHLLGRSGLPVSSTLRRPLPMASNFDTTALDSLWEQPVFHDIT